ncbi:regulatory protein GemA [Duganella sp. FT3S]|uniref:Regulatory protein GemA n=1 Tax=Rugamonas fusca TaxID=2758568 RepID=A0A7W2I6Y4_9BURK|nr:regulatory protein GemA [Rugamonas fusca]MBA5605855.1 regulatory protein GemA [Rugamonas fusca]
MSRNANLAKIHIAKKQLAMDDDTYRAMLLAHGGVSSSKDLTLIGAAKVLAHLERCGFKPKASGGGKRPNAAAANRGLLGKIEAQLADARRPWSYGHGMAKKMFNIDKIDWLNAEQLGKIIAALSIDAKRRAAQVARASKP